MGRKKIAIKKINDNRRRQVTFVRRKFGLMKKAYELSVLCECDVALVMITAENRLFMYSNKNMQDIIIKHNEVVNEPENCEVLADPDMVKLIEKGKEDLEEYFGTAQDDDDEFEDDDMEDTPKRKRSSSSRPSTSHRASKKAKPVTVPVADAPVNTSSMVASPSSSSLMPRPAADGQQIQQAFFYGPGPNQGFPPNFMPFQPYILYPHPNSSAAMQGVSGGNAGNPNSNTGDNEGKLSSGGNSAFHLPAIGPFSFPHHLSDDGNGSSQSLNQHNEGGLNNNSGMFAGGMYYPFGTHWQTMAGLHHSNSAGEMRQTNSTIDLIAAAEAAATEPQHSVITASEKVKTLIINNDSTDVIDKDNNINDNMESVKMKEINAHEEALKADQSAEKKLTLEEAEPEETSKQEEDVKTPPRLAKKHSRRHAAEI
eukprot:Partr_v1_DN25603_c0_g1_i1_m4577 putative myocyte enhancer factor